MGSDWSELLMPKLDSQEHLGYPLNEADTFTCVPSTLLPGTCSGAKWWQRKEKNQIFFSFPLNKNLKKNKPFPF